MTRGEEGDPEGEKARLETMQDCLQKTLEANAALERQLAAALHDKRELEGAKVAVEAELAQMKLKAKAFKQELKEANEALLRQRSPRSSPQHSKEASPVLGPVSAVQGTVSSQRGLGAGEESPSPYMQQLLSESPIRPIYFPESPGEARHPVVSGECDLANEGPDDVKARVRRGQADREARLAALQAVLQGVSAASHAGAPG